MKKPEHVMAAVLAILLLGGLFWNFRTPRSAVPSVAVIVVTNSSGGPVGEATFRITNGENRAILLTDLIVETNSPAGWQSLSQTIPTHPQRLAVGDIKDVVLAAPGDETPWRLRITYGRDVKGPRLWLGKVDYAISQHAWPGRGFGIMAGSNSCLSEVMSR